jgi:hypothetical protein
MVRLKLVLAVFFLSATVSAHAQHGGPFAGPGVPSYNPGVPSYNPGVPRQAPGPAFGRDAFRLGGQRILPSRQQSFVVPPRGFVPFRGQTIIVVPAPRRRPTFEDPFFGDSGDPFF